jgi:outer membrane protein W
MFRNLLICATLAAATGAYAEQGDQWVAVKGAYTQFDSHAGPRDKGGYGLGYGAWFTDHVGLDISLLRTDLQSTVPTATATSQQVQLLGSFLFGFNPLGEHFHPYFAAGVGATQIGKPFSDSHRQTTRVNYHAGLGAQFRLGEHFALTLDSKYVRTQASTVRNDWVSFVGLGYTWKTLL